MAVINSPIKVIGAKENNLKNINLELKPGQLIVFTGLSGAGKSTLLFDVLHAEGQRNYVETFSPYVRQFLETLKRPNVKGIKNIRPSIAVEQKNTVRNSRSTVGTMTELCDYFKVWFSQVATFYDPETAKPLQFETSETLAEKTFHLKGYNIYGFLANKPDSLSSKDFLSFLIKAGHARGFYKSKYMHLEDLIHLKWNKEEIFVVVDRISSKKENKSRIIEAITLAIKHGHGIGEIRDQQGKHINFLFHGLRSPKTGLSFSPANPSAFSFNSPIGACFKCKGFGKIIEIDQNLVIPDQNLSIKNGAVKAFSGKVYGHCQDDLVKACKEHNISIDSPWNEISFEKQILIWDGDPAYREGNKKWYGIKSFF